MKYKMGDKVRVGKFAPQSAEDGYGDLIWPEGRVGVIRAVYQLPDDAPYGLDFLDAEESSQWPSLFAEEELEAI